MVDYKQKLLNNSIIDNTIININIFSFAQEAKSIPPLSPILGAYNINSIEFCTKFDLLTINYIKGLKIPAIITKKIKAKEFELNLKNIKLATLLEIFISHQYNIEDKNLLNAINFINIELLFDLIILYSNLYKLTLPSSAKLILSNISCYKNILQIN